MKFIFILLAFLTIDCIDNDDFDNQEVEKKDLEKLAEEIKAIADSSSCSENTTCDFVGFGSKPCGGNWEYLVYSNSIDVADFLAKVKAYNNLEEAYNVKYNVISNCMAVLPPDDVVCDNGKCKAVYNF